MARPRLTEKKLAGMRRDAGERIFEFGHGENGTGGLMSLRSVENDRLRLNIYRAEGPIELVVSQPVTRPGGTVPTGRVLYAPPGGPMADVAAMHAALTRIVGEFRLGRTPLASDLAAAEAALDWKGR